MTTLSIVVGGAVLAGIVVNLVAAGLSYRCPFLTMRSGGAPASPEVHAPVRIGLASTVAGWVAVGPDRISIRAYLPMLPRRMHVARSAVDAVVVGEGWVRPWMRFEYDGTTSNRVKVTLPGTADQWIATLTEAGWTVRDARDAAGPGSSIASSRG